MSWPGGPGGDLNGCVKIIAVSEVKVGNVMDVAEENRMTPWGLILPVSYKMVSVLRLLHPMRTYLIAFEEERRI